MDRFFFFFSRNHFKSSKFIWLTRVKRKKWANFIGFRTKFDFARLNENSTALFCMYNFCCGTEYRERKINFKRLHLCRREREELLKSRTRCRISLLIVSTEIVFTNLTMWHGLVNNKNYWCRNTERNSQMTKKHWEMFLQNIMYICACVVGSFSRELQFRLSNKISWTLSWESKIIGSLRAWQAAKFSNSLARAITSIELHCKDKSFAEESR